MVLRKEDAVEVCALEALIEKERRNRIKDYKRDKKFRIFIGERTPSVEVKHELELLYRGGGWVLEFISFNPESNFVELS